MYLQMNKKNKQCLLYYRDNLVEKKKKANARRRKNTPQLTITDGCALLNNHTLVLFKLVAREKKKKSENESGIRISKLNQSFAFRLGLNICRFYVAN